MPDNGYGNKANSRDFHLRVYRIRPDFKTGRGGSGEIEVVGWVELSDPWRKIPFPIVNEDTDRILTGGDPIPHRARRAQRRGDRRARSPSVPGRGARRLPGITSVFKKVFLVDLRDVDSSGYLVKREVLDLLDIADPHGLSLPGREGDVGLGEHFSFPYETIEALLPLDDGRVLVMNDNNYPFSAGRNPNLPDYNDMIVVRVRSLERER